MGKFVYVLEPKLYRQALQKGLLRFIPESIFLIIVNRMKPKVVCRYLNQKGTEIKGYGIGVFTSEKNSEKERFIDSIIECINSLKEENITRLCLYKHELLDEEDVVKLEDNCNVSFVDGRTTRIQLVLPVIKEIYNYNNINLKEQEVLIINDDLQYEEELIRDLALELKYLSVYGENEEYMHELSDKILISTGLSIHIVRGLEGKLSKYNIIINFKDNIELNVKDIKRKAIIFDLSKKNSLRKLVDKRKDVIIITDFMLKKPSNIRCDISDYSFEQDIPSHIYETMKNVNSRDFKRVVIRDKSYTIKQVSKIFLKGNETCRYFISNVKN
ncbi:hypothetical protein [Caldisalinibacter kiritimatiensis]|uniref:Uncharacterized protein n=1 Tax=Caldisalinibacter kiritimatiensis TaxID=1304284 RepID=R1ASZ8_9FIRM|nr:hypothetical protein [Caldisalinibacter kiritimatiensis]EOC99776.1 hypothetical protein L21TH_2192 [Caldisalinibacter kiritimatiensis]